MRARRRFETFSLSFLDIMSCGFGAVVLFFVIINATMAKRSDELNKDLSVRAEMLRVEVVEGEENLVELRNTMEDLEKRRVEAQGRARRILEMIREKREELANLQKSTVAREESIEKLQSDLKSLEEDSKRLSAASDRPSDEGTRVRSYVGEGDRQYLTGVKVGGQRVLILLDASASMLDDTVVNVIRRRNLPEAQKIRSPKWQRALATVEWITTQLKVDSQFQIHTFSEDAGAALPDTAGRWLDTADPENLAAAIAKVREIVPGGGTSLWQAFESLSALDPPPDNIFLVTDGLPTHGDTRPRGTTVSGKDRLKFFEKAVGLLPARVPINVVLFPMEGDADAASAFWKLAIASRGSYLAPSRDWP
jgi:hypothetical protein